MEKHKKDESVKAGLQLEANTNTVKRKRKRIPLKRNLDHEVDPDETVHEKGFQASTDHDEADVDDLVHSTHAAETINDNNGEDPDEKVHEADDLDPEK
jgi:hypothetical protein